MHLYVLAKISGITTAIGPIIWLGMSSLMSFSMIQLILVET